MFFAISTHYLCRSDSFCHIFIENFLSIADLHMAQLMPLPLTVSCFSKIQIGFTYLLPAHLGSPEKGPLNGSMCFIEHLSVMQLVGVIVT